MSRQITLVSLAVFKYYYNGEGYFPSVPLYVSAGDKKLKLHALVDSGATISVFKDEVADQLGIDIERGREIYLGGVGGRIKGYIHKLEVEIAGKKFFALLFFPANIWFPLIYWAGMHFLISSKLFLRKRKIS